MPDKTVQTARGVTLASFLERWGSGEEDPLPFFIGLFDLLRPPRSGDDREARRRWQELLQLAAEEPYRQILADALGRLFLARRQQTLYTEAGLLPNTGFFTELRRKLAHKLLPELADPAEVRDALGLIFHRSGDRRWMEAIPRDERLRFWQLAAPLCHDRRTLETLIAAARILSLRVGAMGLEPELLRVLPRLREVESPFVAMHDELSRFVADCCRGLESEGGADGDERHLLVLLAQCRETIERARHGAAKVGTSFSLSFLLTRLHQHLDRLELLVAMLAERFCRCSTPADEERWAGFIVDVVEKEHRRNSLRQHFSDLFGQVALRMTENAARTGEHYIARDTGEWRGMWRAAAGGGMLIALLALLKLLGSGLHLPLLNHAVLNGLIYGCGFMLVHVLHFTIATKQPAMTAAAIAATIGQSRGRLRHPEELLDLMVATSRSQVAAIAGNVMIAFPLACTVALLLGVATPVVPPEKALALLADVSPHRSLALFYAAVAGVWLFLAGLVSGHVDNLSAYDRIAPRVAGHPWLLRILGPDRATRLGDYLGANAGGLTGNLFFGLLLGLTPAIGTMFGVPLDIRHVAFSSANLGYALIALDLGVDWQAAAVSAVGVALIGMVNLLVSFSLALWVAMRARGVPLREIFTLAPQLGRRLLARPLDFIWYRKDQTPKTPT